MHREPICWLKYTTEIGWNGLKTIGKEQNDMIGRANIIKRERERERGKNWIKKQKEKHS